MLKSWVVMLVLAATVLPSFGAGNKTFKTTYAVSCGEVWAGVKAALANPENYKDVNSDDAKMMADYNVKHSLHWSVTGAINQGKNKVSLVPVNNACEMSVMSMYSGFSHNDAGDFRKRVEESMAKLKNAPPQPAKPEDQAKTAEAPTK